MKRGINFFSDPTPEDVKAAVQVVVAAGQNPFDYEYLYSDIDQAPMGGYCVQSGYKFVVALYRH